MPAIKSLEELRKIKEEALQKREATQASGRVQITVPMGTCGIAAGAREVMNALMEEMAQTDRQDIRVVTSGCMGMCSSEPNVTVEIQDAEPIVYQKMEANRMRQVFKRHVLLGEVQTDFALAKM